MINLADKLTAKTVEGILADSNEIKYTKEMGDTAKAETVAKELSNMTDSMSGLSNSVTTLSQEFETTQSDIEQLLNKAEQYTDRFVDNPIANSENAGLMSAADKTKLDSYPSQFVLDLGLVESQTVGEQMAAASEVAGNRNISFIRFQVKGVSTLKTTLILQWPNGINETAQIMCVDKAQWRRNVTGATGVKGDTTNAFQWERTAPHFIAYDKSRRMIQLKDYQQIVLQEVELPIATPTQHGLMSSTDKEALDNAAEKADTALRMMPFDGVFGNPTIETQGVSSYDAIIFDDIRCLFLARKNNKFYMSFIGSENYNTITSVTMKARTDRIFFRTDTKRTYIFNGTALSNLSISDEEVAKLANYPNTPLEIPLASEKSQGLMSAADKAKLDQTKPVEEVTWTKDHHMSGYTECGEFHIKGQRINKYDGMPIINANPGHTIDATLTVLDSSLSGGTGAKTDACVTQVLRMSNRTGGDGHIWIRTGQGVDKEQLAWGTWEKLMGMFEKNDVYTLDDLDGYTTNGMYSGIYAGTEPKNFYLVRFLPGDTFLMITINGYAASQFATPQITQLLYKLPAKTLESEQNAEIYLRTGSYNKTDKVWVWGNFTKMVTNADLASQVANLTTKINQNAANIASATTTASEALTTATEAQATATSASENAAQAQQLANEAKTIAEQTQSTAENALSEAIDAKSNAATAFGAASNAKSIADAAQTKNIEQDERLMHIEENLAHLGIAGRYWDEDNATSTAENYYGSLQALRDLPKRLGLGRYLVTDDRKRKKLDPKDSTKYLDGSPAALDGSEGQCMWCWNGFYANVWHEGSRLIKAVTFDGPVGGETSVWIPAGGISWLGAGVIDRGEAPFTDREKWTLCSVINDSPQFRGGAGVALDPSSYSKAPAASTPQISMLGMPATYISTEKFSIYARKRGEGWEANWFVARFVVEFLFEIIMGTENSQAEFNPEKDADGLYQGGFGTGVTSNPDIWEYNGGYPLLPTSLCLDSGDSVGLVPYSLPKTVGADGDVFHTFNVPVFFGLVGAGFGHLQQLVNGLIVKIGEDKSLVYVSTSMYSEYSHNTIEDKILVSECPREIGNISRKSYKGLCCIPTMLGGSSTTRYADFFHTDTQIGIVVRQAGGLSNSGNNAGVSCSYVYVSSTNSQMIDTSPLCYFEEDPIIPESEKIEI